MIYTENKIHKNQTLEGNVLVDRIKSDISI